MLLEYLKVHIPDKLASFISYTISAWLFTLIYFTHPTFKPVAKIIDGYAQFSGTEQAEMRALQAAHRII